MGRTLKIVAIVVGRIGRDSQFRSIDRQVRYADFLTDVRRVTLRAARRLTGVLRAQRFNVRLGRRVDFVMWSLLREEL